MTKKKKLNSEPQNLVSAIPAIRCGLGETA